MLPSVKKIAAKFTFSLIVSASALIVSAPIQAATGLTDFQPDIDTVEAARVQTPAGDAQFRAIFNSWKRLDQIGQTSIVAIPSAKPVSGFAYTSGFGVRSDPFRHSAAMHAGVDLAGPLGTPIYATADGVVSYSGWMRGYGNLVEIAHGKDIETRYGHLSKLLVKPNSRVRRGQLIALMGSTGRSTGSHLHYEVRIDGRAVDPIPFIQSTDYVIAMQKRIDNSQVALGGPDE